MLFLLFQKHTLESLQGNAATCVIALLRYIDKSASCIKMLLNEASFVALYKYVLLY